jgi:iron(III) transport system substrate-binding protein
MKGHIALVGLLASLLVADTLPASAQDARVEAAKKEGKVVWYTSLALPSAEKVAKLFEAAYPGSRSRCTARARSGSCSA